MTTTKKVKKDENPEETEQVQESETVTPAEPKPVHAAHPVDENPEEHIGDETRDPWDDEDQKDWPNAHTESDDAGTEGSE